MTSSRGHSWLRVLVLLAAWHTGACAADDGRAGQDVVAATEDLDAGGAWWSGVPGGGVGRGQDTVH